MDEKEKPKGRGGAGRGQGQKPSYGEKTKPVTIKVPESKVDDFKEMAKKWLEAYKLNRNTQ